MLYMFLIVSILIDPTFLAFCGAFSLEVWPYDRLLKCLFYVRNGQYSSLLK